MKGPEKMTFARNLSPISDRPLSPTPRLLPPSAWHALCRKAAPSGPTLADIKSLEANTLLAFFKENPQLLRQMHHVRSVALLPVLSPVRRIAL